MKKTSKMLSAVVLSAALAMGTTMPAFAYKDVSNSATADSSVSTDVNKFEGSKDGMTADGKTNVDVLYRSKIIKAQIPMKVTIVATGTSTSPGDIMAPTSDKYQITNTGDAESSSYADLYVSKVVSKATTGSEWALTDGEIAAGQLKLTLADASEYASVNLDGKSAGVTLTEGDWPITRGNSLGLKLAGQSQPSMTLYQAAVGASGATNKLLLTEDAFSITYTVSMSS